MEPEAAARLAWSTSGEWDIKEVDERDKSTPDEWVHRHPELVRLTGTAAAMHEAVATPFSFFAHIEQTCFELKCRSHRHMPFACSLLFISLDFCTY